MTTSPAPHPIDPTKTTKAARRSGRRGNGEGSITQLSDGRWQARVTLDGGKRKAYYGKTRAAVQQKLTAALRDRDRGLPIGIGERQTLAQYVPAWLGTIKPTVRLRTWKCYAQLMNRHAIPALGATPLAKLSAQQVQRLYGMKLEEGLSGTTVHHLHAVLHRALAQAERLGLVARNVSELVEVPRMAEHEMRVLDSEQVRRLLDVARGERLEALYVLAVSTGMRQGELLALRWEDVDLDRRTVHVRATLQRTKEHGYTLAAPKTKRSRRQISLTGVARDALRAHRARQAQERLAAGPAWQGTHDLVFADAAGGPLSGIQVTRAAFYPLLKRAGLPRVRFHDLRHTAATLLLGRGVNPKVVSEMLGHASVGITLDIYSHVLPDMQEQAAAQMDAALGGLGG
jgi:integrase